MSKIMYGADEKIPGESAYDRCSYKGCKNGKYRMGGRKLFLFPSHTEYERREKWLQNCGNEELRKKADSSIRRSGICSDHFDSSSFTDDKKFSLKRNSIPLPNYPPIFNDNSSTDSSINKNNDLNSKKSMSKQNSNCSTRVPRLFADDDDYYTDYEDICDMEKTEDTSLINNDNYIENDNSNNELENWADKSDLFSIDDKINDFVMNSCASTPMKMQNTNSPYELKDSTKINTPLSTIELLRKMNEEHNKDKKIEKLIKQNASLRKELKTLKQNVRRWERRRQKKSTLTMKPTLKQQKRMVLNIVNEMDISSVAKAIISLQLHTRKAPYTEEEKNLAKSFEQYSRNDIKRLINAGCNVPSQSSIRRWLSDFDEQSSLSISAKDLSESLNTEDIQIH